MRNKKKLCAGILMLLLLTGCSSQEVLQEVPQTIVLPESQIDTSLCRRRRLRKMTIQRAFPF